MTWDSVLLENTTQLFSCMLLVRPICCHTFCESARAPEHIRWVQLAAKSPSQNDDTLLTPKTSHLQALVISAARIVANSVGQQTLSFKGQALGWFILIMHGVTIVRPLSLF